MLFAIGKIDITVREDYSYLNHLEEYRLDISKLKQWEIRSYKAYDIRSIITPLKISLRSEWPGIIKKHILTLYGNDIGASCIDIYLFVYVSQNYGYDRKSMFEFVKEKNISNKMGSANAIYQVGKGDGVYLGIVDEKGRIKDADFWNGWVK